ncbi:alpha/beta fold hydrolase [Haliangium sp.]|uniref:alpha/beta fold hydrolase n=1 Tax=Haliangium sp. TaxID=2663208 RepID=UPI003D0F7494
MKRWLAVIAAVLIAVLIALPWVCDREDRDMNDEERARVSDSAGFAALPRGTTHYELSGPPSGPLVVLVHGTSGPMTVWDRTAPTLADAGYRVLRFDLYGRGYSDRPDEDYDLALYVEQIERLLDSIEGLRAGAEAHGMVVMGSSLGALITSEYALQHPQAVRAVALIGPAGFPLQASPLAKLINVPGVAEYMMSVVGDRQLVTHHRGYFEEPEAFSAYHDGFASMLRYRDTKRAILRTLRNAPLQSFLDRYRDFGRLGMPTLVVWGENDATFPYANHRELLDRVPHAELVTVEATRHLPQLERSDVVGPALVAFLGRVFAPDRAQ